MVYKDQINQSFFHILLLSNLQKKGGAVYLLQYLLVPFIQIIPLKRIVQFLNCFATLLLSKKIRD